MSLNITLDFTYMNKMITRPVFLILAIVSIGYGCSNEFSSNENDTLLTPKQLLGKQLFFDTRFSEPAGQACGSCHNPEAGFALAQNSGSKNSIQAISAGAVTQRFGNRNTPTISYAAYIPKLHFDTKEQHYVGGLFLDGRSNTLEEQASGPLTNPVEMAIPNKKVLFQKLKSLGYEDKFKKVYGENVYKNADSALAQLVSAISAYERSHELSPFNSKYDAYLNGKVSLNEQEMRGLKLFEAEEKGNCAACHPSKLDKTNKDEQRPLFTDFTYDNIGVPANTENPFYTQPKEFNPEGEKYIDKGLGSIVKDKNHDGKFRVPTLRNIAKTAPYMHNGVFKTLKEVVDFYNTRDTKEWPKPEVSSNVNEDELGDLKLTEQEVDDLVVFMKTLSDGYK